MKVIRNILKLMLFIIIIYAIIHANVCKIHKILYFTPEYLLGHLM